MNIAAIYEAGKKAERNGNYAEARNKFEKLVSCNYAPAITALGKLYFVGAGVAINKKKAADLFQRAANSYDPEAFYLLGMCFECGYGRKVDYRKAFDYYMLAAKRGIPEAQSSLGDCYLNGRGTQRETDQAVRWYIDAANNGDAWGEYKLSGFCRKGYKRIVAQNLSRSIELLENAAFKGIKEAQYDLAAEYEAGFIFVRDYDKAILFYQYAAQGGFAKAQKRLNELGIPYQGIDPDEEYEKRLELKAAEQDKIKESAEPEEPEEQDINDGVEIDADSALDGVKISSPSTATLEEAIEELNGLIGLQDVKDKVNRLINVMKVNEARRAKNLSVGDVTNHLVLLGKPGTGKTTVARIMANIFKALGVVSKGQLVETDRSGLVGQYIGATEAKTRDVIERALGGVLFIDEAYALAGKSENDFGKEAIEVLLKAMEDNRDDLVVIAAGYEEEMEDFINSNPGLKSRFQTFIHLKDYSAEETAIIFKKICADLGYAVDDGASAMVDKLFDLVVKEKADEFANGRTARNFFKPVQGAMSDRLILKYGDVSTLSHEILSVFTKDDIVAAAKDVFEISLEDSNSDQSSQTVGIAKNQGKFWSREEEQKLQEMFSRDERVWVIAEELGRSRRAIEMRLEKMGLISDDGSYSARQDALKREELDS